jgi:hypothetical protein
MALLICHISVKHLYFWEKNYSAKENIERFVSMPTHNIRIGSFRVTVLKIKKQSARKPMTGDLQI